MKITGLIALILLSGLQKSSAWGFWGHRTINRMACFTLPPDLFRFYKDHLEYITNHSVDPDKRRYSNPDEAPRHFIDIDHYGNAPFDSVPQKWKDAVEKFSEDSLKKYGIVPWHINRVYYQLVNAFKEKDVSKILYYSANLGHYIADSHVPLHCTENYNGQLTNQNGIHGFWESRLPELFGDNFDFFLGEASYIENLQSYSWHSIKQSFDALDSVLSFEKKISSTFEVDQKYAFEVRGNQLSKVYSKAYAQEYSIMLDGQVERRMQCAILSVGSFWYTAWVDAGMPDLSDKKISGENVIVPDDESKIDSSGKFIPKQDCE